MIQLLWLLSATLVLSVFVIYIGRRFVRPVRKGKGVRALIWCAVAFLPGLFIYVTLNDHTSAQPAPEWMEWSAYVGLGFLSFVLFLLLMRDIPLGLWRLAGRIRLRLRRSRGGDLPADADRRAFLLNASNLAIIGASATLTGFGVIEARMRPSVVRIPIGIDHLHPGLDGLTIAHITDIHAGLTVRRDWIEMVAEEVGNLHPDIVAFTGDFADAAVQRLRSDVAPFGEIKSRFGKYFVTGNHEYYAGVEEWIEEIDRLGYTVLINAHDRIERNGGSLIIAGVTDATAGSFLKSHESDPGLAVAGVEPSVPKILLAHQPKSLYAAGPFHFDLMLSGHTHGGQFIPWNYLATFGQPYISGLHRTGTGWIYVSRGTGYWGPPVRLAARSEVTLFTLHSRPASAVRAPVIS